MRFFSRELLLDCTECIVSIDAWHDHWGWIKNCKSWVKFSSNFILSDVLVSQMHQIWLLRLSFWQMDCVLVRNWFMYKISTEMIHINCFSARNTSEYVKKRQTFYIQFIYITLTTYWYFEMQSSRDIKLALKCLPPIQSFSTNGSLFLSFFNFVDRRRTMEDEKPKWFIDLGKT